MGKVVCRQVLKVSDVGVIRQTNMYDVETGEKLDFSPFSKVSRGNRKKRGKILSFSSQSKSRLLQKVVEAGVLPDAFLTLTFPKSYPCLESCREELRVFLQKYARKGLYFIWRLEAQKRGAPHFHILVYTNGVNGFKRSMKKDWVERMNVINQSFEKSQQSTKKAILKHSFDYVHLAVGADSRKKVFLYIAKYASKVQKIINPDGSPFYEKNRGQLNYSGIQEWANDDGIRKFHTSFIEGDELFQVDTKTGELKPHKVVNLPGRQWGTQGKIKQTFETIEIPSAALEQYLDEFYNETPDKMGITRKVHLFSEHEKSFFLSNVEKYVSQDYRKNSGWLTLTNQKKGEKEI